jgi:hypothetical protein
MKKIKVILTSIVLVTALSFAYASSDVRRFDYFYYPGSTETGTPTATTSTDACTIQLRGCTKLINGVNKQLFILVDDVYVPVKKP